MADIQPPAASSRGLERSGALLASLAFAILAAIVYIRGSVTDSSARDPRSSSEGLAVQLYREPGGRTQVRCSAVLDYPPASVWAVVTDYARFPEIFKTLLWRVSVSRSEREADGRVHLVGELRTPLGGFPMDVRVLHAETDGKNTASWDAASGRIRTNRGSWTVSSAGPGAALLVYSLEVSVSPFPDFLVNSVLRDQVRHAVNAVRRRLSSQRAG